MKYFKKLEGERIYLSPINIDDVEIYTKWMNDKEVVKGTHAVAKIFNLETEKNWINNCLESGSYTFGIVLKNGDELIGNCGIVDINSIDRTANVGIFIGEEKYRNNGYGREALCLIIEYGFNILNLHNIDLSVFSFNKRAINCYKKIGFKEYGRRHECYFLDGNYYDKILMELLEDDYRNYSDFNK